VKGAQPERRTALTAHGPKSARPEGRTTQTATAQGRTTQDRTANGRNRRCTPLSSGPCAVLSCAVWAVR